LCSCNYYQLCFKNNPKILGETHEFVKVCCLLNAHYMFYLLKQDNHSILDVIYSLINDIIIILFYLVMLNILENCQNFHWVLTCSVICNEGLSLHRFLRGIAGFVPHLLPPTPGEINWGIEVLDDNMPGISYTKILQM
jgi:hypothetical protein